VLERLSLSFDYNTTELLKSLCTFIQIRDQEGTKDLFLQFFVIYPIS